LHKHLSISFTLFNSVFRIKNFIFYSQKSAIEQNLYNMKSFIWNVLCAGIERNLQ